MFYHMYYLINNNLDFKIDFIIDFMIDENSHLANPQHIISPWKLTCLTNNINVFFSYFINITSNIAFYLGQTIERSLQVIETSSQAIKLNHL